MTYFQRILKPVENLTPKKIPPKVTDKKKKRNYASWKTPQPTNHRWWTVRVPSLNIVVRWCRCPDGKLNQKRFSGTRHLWNLYDTRDKLLMEVSDPTDFGLDCQISDTLFCLLYYGYIDKMFSLTILFCHEIKNYFVSRETSVVFRNETFISITPFLRQRKSLVQYIFGG